LDISLAPEPVFRLGGLVITNTMFTSLLVVVLLSVVAIVYRAVASVDNPGRFQMLIEWVTGFVLSASEGAAGRRLGRRIFPLVATFFIFILTANWLGNFPGFGSIKIVNFEGKSVPLLRSVNSDLNMTAAMALIAVVTVQVLALAEHGLVGYLKELTTPWFLTPIHLISEISHVISLAGRLFGNIFGGEVLMIVMYSLVPYVVPAVFLGLEIFFGFIQAMIFTMLSIAYIAMAAGPTHGEQDLAVSAA
jgi:F-type H+-transporting ATPase subunit a